MNGWHNNCYFSDWMTIQAPVDEGEVFATIGDTFSWTCGFYTYYEWNGDGDAYFTLSYGLA